MQALVGLGALGAALHVFGSFLIVFGQVRLQNCREGRA